MKAQVHGNKAKRLQSRHMGRRIASLLLLFVFLLSSVFAQLPAHAENSAGIPVPEETEVPANDGANLLEGFDERELYAPEDDSDEQGLNTPEDGSAVVIADIPDGPETVNTIYYRLEGEEAYTAYEVGETIAVKLDSTTEFMIIINDPVLDEGKPKTDNQGYGFLLLGAAQTSEYIDITPIAEQWKKLLPDDETDKRWIGTAEVQAKKTGTVTFWLGNAGYTTDINLSILDITESPIHVHNIRIGNAYYNDESIHTVTKMFNAFSSNNNASHRYIVYVGQTLDLSGAVEGTFALKGDNTDIFSVVDDTSDILTKSNTHAAAAQKYLALKPGTCQITFTGNDGKTKEVFYVEVRYPINVVTALGEYHKDTVHEYLEILSGYNTIHSPSNTVLYVKNSNFGGNRGQYHMFQGGQVQLTAYVLENEKNHTSFATNNTDYVQVVPGNDETVDINGVSFIKKTATVKAINAMPVDWEEKPTIDVIVTFGDEISSEPFYVHVQAENSLYGGDHYDIETKDGATYTQETTSTHQDGSWSFTVAQYSSSVSGITSCTIYDAQKTVLDKLLKGDYAKHRVGMQDEYTSAFKTDNQEHDDRYGSHWYETIQRSIKAAEVSEVVFDLDLDLKLQSYDIDRYDARNRCIYTVHWETTGEKVGSLRIDNKTSKPITFTITQYENGSSTEVGTREIAGGGSETWIGLPNSVYAVTGKDAGGYPTNDTLADSREDFTVNNTIVTLNGQEVLDAFNKCPDHSGFDFAIQAGEPLDMVTGDLELKKVLEPYEIDRGEEFEFVVTLSGTGSDSKAANTITGKYGDVDFFEGRGTVTLKAGETKTARYLPAGLRYTVTETTKPGYVRTASYTDTGILSYRYPKSSGAAARAFTFELTMPDEYQDETYKYSYSIDGGAAEELTFTREADGSHIYKGTVTLQPGQTIVFSGLPAGIAYTVTGTGTTGTTAAVIDPRRTNQASVTITNTPEPGSLTITKIVTDGNPDTQRTFNFKVTLSDTTISGLHGGVTFTGGVATFPLKHNASVTITDIPVGTEYTVEETDAAVGGYTPTIVYADTGVLMFGHEDEANKGQKAYTITLSPDGDADLSNHPAVGYAKNGVERPEDFTFKKDAEKNIYTATVTLKYDQGVFISGLPVGTKYTVKATGVDLNGTAKATVTESNEAAAVYALNTSSGDLKLSKTVTGAAGNPTTLFTFNITLTPKKVTVGGKTVPLKLAATYPYTGKSEVDGVEAPADGNLILRYDQAKGVYTGSVSLKHGQSVTIKGLPDGTIYEVKEMGSGGYDVTYGGETGMITKDAKGDSPKEVTVTNNRDVATGSLKISKTVKGNAADKSKVFQFSITLKDQGGASITADYRFTGDVSAQPDSDPAQYGSVSDEYTPGSGDGTIKFTNGEATVYLADGQSLTIDGLPVDAVYEVRETDNGGYTVSTSGKTSDTIKADEVAKVEFINTKNSDGPTFTNLTVKKVWDDGNSPDRPALVTVQLYRDDAPFGESVVLDDTNDWRYTWTGLSTDYAWAVVEVEVPEGYHMTSAKNGTVWTITNRKPTEEAGDLIVSKIVQALGADGKPRSLTDEEANQAFTFAVTLSDKTINGKYGDMNFTDGAATFTLRNGESVTATGLPAGITYTVVESGSDGYTVTKSGAEGTIAGGKIREAWFINQREDAPEHTPETKPGSDVTPATGDNSMRGLYLVLMAISAAGLILILFVGQKRYRNKSRK